MEYEKQYTQIELISFAIEPGLKTTLI